MMTQNRSQTGLGLCLVGHIVVLFPRLTVKRQVSTPQPCKPAAPQTARRAPASAGPGGRRPAANTRRDRPQTAHAILSRPPAKGRTPFQCTAIISS